MTTTLASWRDGAAKRAIVDLVTSANADGSGFVPLVDRIATFDNDGTGDSAERARKVNARLREIVPDGLALDDAEIGERGKS
jgi:hypothetical protein